MNPILNYLLLSAFAFPACALGWYTTYRYQLYRNEALEREIEVVRRELSDEMDKCEFYAGQSIKLQDVYTPGWNRPSKPVNGSLIGSDE